VVRYDKRGVGQSGGRPEASTIADYADDVRAVVRYLRTRKDVDRDRIAVVGYGDGGFTAMQAASREDRIHSLVLLASIGTNGTAYTLERQQREIERLGLSEVDRQERIDLQKKILTAASTGSGWEGVPPASRAGGPPWFRSFLLTPHVLASRPAGAHRQRGSTHVPPSTPTAWPRWRGRNVAAGRSRASRHQSLRCRQNRSRRY
jgi:pimeloyl-ACP methyl ester carboxylesterase